MYLDTYEKCFYESSNSSLFRHFSQSLFRQGCQMVYFQTKVPNLGYIWSAFDWKMSVYFMAIWNRYVYNRHSGYCMVIWYIFPVLVSCTKKNLATLVARIDSKCSIVPTSTLFDRSRQQFTSSYVCYNPICSKRQNETCLQFLSSNKMSD
jgi:hypothetical protein